MFILNILFRVIVLLNFINLFRFCCGYVTFEAAGGFPDKFLNSCKAEGMTLFGITRKNGIITAHTFANDYKSMPAARRSSDMKVRIKERRGLPFMIWKRRNRIGIPIGIVIFFILINALSCRVWSLEVVGNSQVDVNDILEGYADAGITIGTKLSSVNLDKAKEYVLELNRDLIWTSFNSSGGLGVINVREGEPVPELKNDSPPRNVVAKYGGQITKYEVYEGDPEQVCGAAVAKGDLLISGVVTLADGATLLKPADGTVEAKTCRKVTSVLSEDFNLYRVSEVTKRNQISFFALENPLLPTKVDCDKLHSILLENYIAISGVVLPIGIVTTENLELDLMSFENDTRFLTIGLDKFFRAHSEEMLDAEITEHSIFITPDDSELFFEGSYECIENICEYSEIIYTY